MNFRTTYALFGILILLMIAILFSLLLNGGSDSAGDVLAALKNQNLGPKDITSLTIKVRPAEASEKTLFLLRDPDSNQWRMTEPVNATVNDLVVNDILEEFFKAPFIESEDITENLDIHGLGKPSVELIFKSSVDAEETVNLGEVTAGGRDALVFVTTRDAPSIPRALRRGDIRSLFKPSLAESASGPAAPLLRDVSDFRSLQLFAGLTQPLEQVKQLTLTQGKDTLALSRSNSLWTITQPDYGRAELDGPPGPGITGVRALLNLVTSLRVPNASDFIESPGDLAQYDLDADNPKRLTVELTSTSPPGSEQEGTRKQTLSIGKQVPDSNPAKVYVKLANEAVVAQVPAGRLQELRQLVANPKPLRDRTLLRLAQDRIDAVAIQAAGSDFTLYRTGPNNTWQLFPKPDAPQPARAQAVSELLSQLTASRKITDFPAPGLSDEEMGFVTPAARIKLWTDAVSQSDDEQASEPKLPDSPAAELIFGKREADVVYVRRIEGDTTTNVLVPQSLLPIVTRDRLDYIEPNLPSFLPAEAAKLAFQRGQTPYVITRAGMEAQSPRAAKWSFAEPTNLKDRAADPVQIDAILSNLAKLQPKELVDDHASDTTLARLGLAVEEAKLKVTVTLLNGQERVYLFGKDASDPQSVYAKLADNALVFTVSEGVITPLVSGNLQDMIVYRVPTDSITAITLTGWQGVVGNVVHRSVIKKDDAWSWETDPGYPLDPKAIDTFLANLSAPRAEEFVASGVAPEEAASKYGLDPAKGGLRIEFRRGDGEEEPLTLTLGSKASGGKTLYAQTNQLPGEVFTLLADRYQSLKQSAAVFLQKPQE